MARWGIGSVCGFGQSQERWDDVDFNCGYAAVARFQMLPNLQWSKMVRNLCLKCTNISLCYKSFHVFHAQKLGSLCVTFISSFIGFIIGKFVCGEEEKPLIISPVMTLCFMEPLHFQMTSPLERWIVHIRSFAAHNMNKRDNRFVTTPVNLPLGPSPGWP